MDPFGETEATAWVATSEDVPGLATEADPIEALSQKLRAIVPDLLISNHVISADYAGAIAIQPIQRLFGSLQNKDSSDKLCSPYGMPLVKSTNRMRLKSHNRRITIRVRRIDRSRLERCKDIGNPAD